MKRSPQPSNLFKSIIGGRQRGQASHEAVNAEWSEPSDAMTYASKGLDVAYLEGIEGFPNEDEQDAHGNSQIRPKSSFELIQKVAEGTETKFQDVDSVTDEGLKSDIQVYSRIISKLRNLINRHQIGPIQNGLDAAFSWKYKDELERVALQAIEALNSIRARYSQLCVDSWQP